MAGDVWIYAEQRDRKLKKVAYELLGAGRTVAEEMGGNLCAVLLGENTRGLAAELGEHGADRVLVAESEDLAWYVWPTPTVPALAAAAKEQRPEVILLGLHLSGKGPGPDWPEKLRRAHG